ncbi:hypothetical protein MTO96_032701 [Rhipicephalus appendiculatus]
MSKLGSPQRIPQQGQSGNVGAPTSQRFTPHGTPLPCPQHQGSLRTFPQAPQACTSAAQTRSRKPPRSSPRMSNASPKSSSTNDAARALSSSANASASPAPNPFRSNPGYLRPSPLDHVRHFNASGSTSETSRNAHGAPVPPAFYVRDIPSNDRRSEAERFVQDVWRE